ncbi:MAG: hypothetical protein GY869_12065, partial [Planctomycetes bacterium]|nr:hypothetical protein [Planctomycetota bacterium]
PVTGLLLQAHLALTNTEDTEQTTLLGDEEITRYRYEVRYNHPDGHQLVINYQDRKRDYEALESEADFRTISTALSLNCPCWGVGRGSYAHSRGDYLNPSGNFVFEQHALTARATTLRYRHVQLHGSLTYLRSRLQADMEKIVFSIGTTIDIGGDYRFMVDYNAHNYDDFAVRDHYYTANVVQIQIQRDINFE